jgi:hypothetical protein
MVDKIWKTGVDRDASNQRLQRLNQSAHFCDKYFSCHPTGAGERSGKLAVRPSQLFDAVVEARLLRIIAGARMVLCERCF